jgi:2-dehydro-3-deoxygluconokinase
MAQLVTFGETPLRLSPPANQRLERATEARLHADGIESNVAVAAHALGTRAVWASLLPDSPLGRRVRSQVDAQGVQTDITWVAPDGCRQGLVFGESARAPRESTRLHDREGTPVASASPSDFPMHRVQDAEMLLSGVNTAVLSQASAESATALLRAGSGAGATAAVALEYAAGLGSPEVYRGVFEELAPHADIVFGREGDIREALAVSGRWRDLASHLTVEYGLDIAVVFRPGYGAVAIEDSERTNLVHERESIDVEPVDTTGEYGAVVGGFCDALLHGDDAASALDTGLAAGALARSMEGPFLTTTEAELDAAHGMLTDGRTS